MSMLHYQGSSGYRSQLKCVNAYAALSGQLGLPWSVEVLSIHDKTIAQCGKNIEHCGSVFVLVLTGWASDAKTISKVCCKITCWVDPLKTVKRSFVRSTFVRQYDKLLVVVVTGDGAWERGLFQPTFFRVAVKRSAYLS